MTRTDTGSRVISAAPARVYAALVDPEALTSWLPPDGMSGRFERFDARPGGSYRLVLTYTDASTAHGKATADSDIVATRVTSGVSSRATEETAAVVDDGRAEVGRDVAGSEAAAR